MNCFRKCLRILLPVVIVAAGFAIMKFLEHARKAPSKKSEVYQGILVDTVFPHVEAYTVKVRGTGIVGARAAISIVPQVNGRVERVSEKFVQGGRFRQGEMFFAVEDVDYRLALAKAKAVLAKSRLQLTIERTKGSVARQDFENISRETAIEPNPLILREPQLEEAEAALHAAEASVRQAEINLERTVSRAPFNCIIKKEHVDLGQYVRAGVSVGEIFGTDVAEVVTPVPLDELTWLDIPDNPGDSSGSVASVVKMVNGEEHVWEGRVSRILGDVDPRGRMARVVVEVMEPFQKVTGQKNMRLYEGMFVDVVIDGASFDRVFMLPSGALRENSTVWVMGSDDRLEIRKVDILRIEKDLLVLRSGVKEQDRIVITDINGAAPGMLLRVASDREAEKNSE
jgi:RND family efflux transporter MFP subunit